MLPTNFCSQFNDFEISGNGLKSSCKYLYFSWNKALRSKLAGDKTCCQQNNLRASADFDVEPILVIPED